MKIVKALVVMLLSLSLCLMVCSCTTKTKPESTLVFAWPAEPNQPWLEFLGVFASEKNFSDPELKWYEEKSINQQPAEKLNNPISSWTMAEDKIVILEKSPYGVKTIDFSTRKVSPLFNGVEPPFEEPVDLAFDKQENLYIVDRARKQVLVFDKGLYPMPPIGTELELNSLEKIALNDRTGILYLSDSFANEIVAYDYQGNLLFRFGTGTLLAPRGIAIHPDGDVYVADTGNAKIRIFSKDGDFLRDFAIGRREVPSPLKKPWDLAFDSRGNLHILDQGLDAFITCRDDGEILFATGSSKWQDDHLFGFNGPTDLQVDNADRVFVADANNHRLIVWQVVDESSGAPYGEMKFSYKEYFPEEQGDSRSKWKSGNIPVFKVGSATSVAFERVVQEGLQDSRDTFKSVFCLGTVRCKSCKGYNNIYVDSKLIENSLGHPRKDKATGAGSLNSSSEEISVQCRKCNEVLTVSSTLFEGNKVRFCLEPREICASER